MIANGQRKMMVDILLPVHHNMPIVRQCIESIVRHTENYNILVWDNGSDDETRGYLEECPHVAYIHQSRINHGFIHPVNALAKCGTSDYLIVMHTDTVVVAPRWSEALRGVLEEMPDVGVSGYGGVVVGDDGQQIAEGFGKAVDYIPSWCMCLSRKTYHNFGLFNDENLEFAYGEDADLCLRLREAGRTGYALHSGAVRHLGGCTLGSVYQQKREMLQEVFRKNHDYLKTRWGNYFTSGRVGLTTTPSPSKMQ